MSSPMACDVYVQFFNGMPATRNLYDCHIGFRARGHRIIPFEAFDEGPEQSPTLKAITREDILCAGIPIFRKVMAHLGVAYKPLETYPVELRPFMGRSVRETTLREVQREYGITTRPFFIKPIAQKLFTGFTVTDRRDMLKVVHIEPETPVYVTPVVEFMSESRVYINRANVYGYHGGVIGVHTYEGNPMIFPDPKAITRMINAYPFGPVAYALDVGVVRIGGKRKTVLVEVNDATSLGNYGLPSPTYADMLECRWRQIVGHPS